MENHYEVLGVKSSASVAEIRRAYRILARRYHPDVNPASNSADKFKSIAEAYRVLGEEKSRAQFDADLQAFQKSRARKKVKGYADQDGKGDFGGDRKQYEETFRRIRAAQKAAQEAAQKAEASRKSPSGGAENLKEAWGKFRQRTTAFLQKPVQLTLKKPKSKSAFPKTPSSSDKRVTKISIIEVSLTVQDAILGIKKTIEVPEGDGARKVSVQIPPGTRTGSVVRLRNRGSTDEEIVMIARVANHPFLSIESKGLVVETPVTVNEAVSGANITVPTLEDPVVVKIPPGTQSGTDIRVRGKGISQKGVERGDLFYRIMIRVPESSNAVGIKEKASEFNLYYEASVRAGYPKNLLEP